jgi:hypothetical protein
VKAKAKEPERVVHLALSQKAAKLFVVVIDDAWEFYTEEQQGILHEARADLNEQIEAPKRKKKTR